VKTCWAEQRVELKTEGRWESIHYDCKHNNK